MKANVLIVAGEASGDLHAARLVADVRRLAPGVSFFGIGGPRMREAGVETAYDVGDMAVMGVSEVLRRYGFFRRVFRELLDAARERRPEAAVLVDYPGFNLRLARRLHNLGIKTLYYICPQVWAWHRARIPRMARFLDRLMVIFPFEPAHFEGSGLRVDFVGHPLVDEARKARAEPPAELPWAGEPRLALLPGSRRHEIARIFPAMWRAAGLLQPAYPELSCIVAAADAAAGRQLEGLASATAGGPRSAALVEGQTRQVLRQAGAAMVASGTATVEAALLSCPMVVAYRVSPLTHALGRRLVSVPHIGMVNIIAGRELCPEFIQDRLQPELLSAAVAPLLRRCTVREEMVRGLVSVAQALGAPGAARRAAECVVAELRGPAPQPAATSSVGRSG